jgi:hypothetical protein
MSTTVVYEAGKTFARLPLPPAPASTFNSDRIALDTAAAVAEANSIIRDAHMRYLRAIVLPEIGDDYTDEEELEWDTLFAQPHVQAGLDRLAEEAERQFATGEIEEGGFAVE